MADFDVDNPAFEPDDWEEDIGNDDVLSTALRDPEVEGMLSEEATTQTSLSLQQEFLQTPVDDYYNRLQRESLTPALGRDPGWFELVDGWLRLKAYPKLDLVNKRTGAPHALSTVANQPGGGVAICDELGFVDWERKSQACPLRQLNPSKPKISSWEKPQPCRHGWASGSWANCNQNLRCCTQDGNCPDWRRCQHAPRDAKWPSAQPTWDPGAWQGPADHQRGAYQQPREAHQTWWSHRLGEAKAGSWGHWWVQQASDCWAPLGPSSRKISPARGCCSKRRGSLLSDQPNARDQQPNPSWRHYTGRASAHPLSRAGGHTREHPHCDSDGYLDPCSGPDWWRVRWKRCDPTTTPVGQGRSSRVGKKLSKLLGVSSPNLLARWLRPCRGSLGALCPGSSAPWGRLPDGSPTMCELWQWLLEACSSWLPESS